MALTKIQAAGLTADLIDETKLADNSLDSEHYNDGSIDHEHLANDAVDADILADNSVGLAAMAHATDGVIITFDANGAPVYVGPGTDGQVLTSTGAGSPPAFENAAAGGLSDVVSDTTPQLGGNLDVNGKNIVFADSSGASDDRLTLGADTDLIIYHDGNSYVTNSTATQLAVQSNDLKLRSFTDLENYLVCTHNGSVDLYYNGSKKFETTSTGAAVTGSLGVGTTSPLKKLHISDAGDVGIALQTTNANTNKEIWEITCGTNASTEADLVFQSRTDAGSGGSEGIRLVNGGAVNLYYDNAKKISTTADGIEIHDLDDTTIQAKFISSGGTLGSVYGNTGSTPNEFGLLDGTGEWAVRVKKDAGVDLIYDGSKKLETTANGVDITGSLTTTDSLTVKGTEGSHGAIQLWSDEGDDNADKWKFLAHSGGDLQIQNYSTGSWQNSIGASGNGGVYLNYAGAEEFRTVANGVELTSDTNASGTTQTIYLTPTTTGSQARSCSIAAVNTDGNNNNALVFKTSAADTPAERLRITQSGEVRVPDGGKFTAGASDDLKIYHDGTTNIIEGLNGNMSIRPKTGENGILVRNDSSVDLYYDDSKKFETTSYGAKVTGKLHHAGIVQVVSSVYQSNRMTTSSNSYVDAWSAVNITPVSSSSKVLVRVTGTAFSVSGSATLGIILRRTVGGSVTGTSPIGNGGNGNITSPDGATIGLYQGDDGSSNVMQTPFSIEWIDSPSTTSTITYDLWIASNNSSGTVGIGGMGNSEDYNTATTIVAMEIGA